MMKEYIENVERKAQERENKENEMRREMRHKKQKQIQELMQMYKKSTNLNIDPENKEDVLKELFQQYGTKKKEFELNYKLTNGNILVPDSDDIKLKATPRKLSWRRSQLSFASTSTDSTESREEQQPKSATLPPESKDAFIGISSRARPTTLQLTLNYETDFNALML